MAYCVAQAMCGHACALLQEYPNVLVHAYRPI